MDQKLLKMLEKKERCLIYTWKLKPKINIPNQMQIFIYFIFKKTSNKTKQRGRERKTKKHFI